MPPEATLHSIKSLYSRNFRMVIIFLSFTSASFPMMGVVTSANKAAKEKLEFTNANKKVEKSARDTANATKPFLLF